METEDRLINAREAARMVNVSAAWIWILTKRGEFAHPVRIGKRQLRFSRKDVLAWIESRKH